ncbi:MAG: hypothetical protein ABI426_04530 [Flavobacterium sp.]
MKYLYLFLVLFSASVFAQDGSSIPSISIPKTEVPKPKDNPSKSEYSLSKPFVPTRFRTAPKFAPISMDKPMQMQAPQASDLDPGLPFQNKLNKPFEDGRVIALAGDKDLGEFMTKSEYITIMCKDYNLIDGDMIRIVVGDLIVAYQIELEKGFKSVKVRLLEGRNVINFIALNEGLGSPNTAEFQVLDDKGNVVYNNMWGLLTGYKASFTIIKE